MKFELASLKSRQVILLSAFIALFSFSGFSGNNNQKGTQAKNTPLFSKFVYQGNDKVYNDNLLKADEFYNPILQGCYPDPAITRKGDDYYLVCSSFAMFPGVPIFHSKDLVNWTQIGHVLDRVSQLKVHDCGISAGIYAPAIKYNPKNDTFYMITTQFSGGFGNIIVKTKDPLKDWSDPIKLQFGGIDPSIFFDDNGKAYVVHNDAPDRGKELYNGHRVIKVWEYDVEKDQVNAGTDKIIVDGGVDLSKKPIWIEAPHIYKKNGKYYGVFLGIRPNEKDRVNIGRETFILPVDWTGEFPVFENGLIPMEPKLKMPKGVENKTGKVGFFPNGNFIFSDDFTSEKLDYRWIGLRGPREAFISVTKKGLQINPFPVNIKEVKPTSTLFHRQQHSNFTYTTTLEYTPASEKDLAGITCVQSEKFNYVFGITKKENDYYILLERTQRGQSSIVASTKIDVKNPIRLQVKAEGDNYEFSYSTDGNDFLNLGGSVSGDILSTNLAGGFTGCLIGLYATSANDALPE